MKNRLTDKQLKMIIIERLNMQSTRRALEVYRLPKYDLNYFESAEFKEVFNKWDKKKKEKFLLGVGGIHAQLLENYIGRAEA